MTTCTREIFKCDFCVGHVIPFSIFIIAMNRSTGFYCSSCRRVYDSCESLKSFSCDGEIKKVWKDGKLFDCVCQKCGKSYGKNYLTREKFLEGFVGV